ncbi:phosphatidylinositol-glycan biosynthesis class X protein isoform X3 [Gopherus evgoodei]|uniref:phosphatidylinositol-glycan biosynthesis class X protein isoform X3 n=1 Tax=Gopherus evgoodei TaxID=1825980 RepID=UPI0011CFB3E5|nr:phosphatidylinositol-glycan biosynthesis class X protein isoform X3 [Gopherus evgoodei]
MTTPTRNRTGCRALVGLPNRLPEPQKMKPRLALGLRACSFEIRQARQSLQRGPGAARGTVRGGGGRGAAQATCPDITVTQQLLKEGFHRDLLTKVELGAGDEAIGSCTVAIKEHLPTGLYVDPYELASLQQHNLTEALMIPDTVDVESPEYLATDLAIVVYTKPDPQCASCFKAMLPVHCRYHRPTEDDGEALTVLKSPEILIHCHKSNPHPTPGKGDCIP